MTPADTARLAEQLGAHRAVPVPNLATALAVHAGGPFRPACDRCAPDPCECPPCHGCGDPILSDDPDRTHTPGTERYHADCCPDCQENGAA